MPAAPVPLDDSVILFVAGAVCLVAGLWMLLHRAARVAAGPLVLLVGAGLVVLPSLSGVRMPMETPPAPAPIAVTPGALTLSADGLRTVAAPAAESRPPPLPGRQAVRIDIEASEAEPNDSIAAANAAELGIAITGALSAGDLDYFAVDVPARTRGDLVAGLTVLEGNAGLSVFDDAGRPLGGADTNEQISVRTTMLERQIAGPRYYVLVRSAPPGATASYRLTIALRGR